MDLGLARGKRSICRAARNRFLLLCENPYARVLPCAGLYRSDVFDKRDFIRCASSILPRDWDMEAVPMDYSCLSVARRAGNDVCGRLDRQQILACHEPC